MAFPGRYERRWRVDGEKPGDVLGPSRRPSSVFLVTCMRPSATWKLCAVLRPIEDQGGELLDDRLDLRESSPPRARPSAAARFLARERLAHLRRGAPLAQSDAEKAERGIDQLER